MNKDALEYLVRLDPKLLIIEQRMQKKILKFLDGAEKEVIKKLQKDGHLNMINMELALKEMEQDNCTKFQKIIEAGIKEGGKFGAYQIYNDLKRHKQFGDLKLSDIHPQVKEEIMNRKQNWATEKMRRMGDNLVETLQQGYVDGKGIDDIAKDITAQFNRTRWQAATIARTEINGAKNEVAYENLQELGIEYKEWSSSDDARVRPSHAHVNGEIVPIDETFSNGLLYPLDPNGPPEEVINCRCSVLSVIR